jgi:glycosyltransferase involved in cell wall biosynthesis
MALILHAPNVHVGGGRALLVPLLGALPPGSSAILDRRLDVPDSSARGARVLRVAPTAGGRIGAERALRSLVGPADTVLCLGNLPPLFALPGRVILFLQNRYLVSDTSLADFALGARLRLRAERLWLHRRKGAIDRLVVQTPSMAVDVRRALGMEATVLPFCAAPVGYARAAPRDRSGVAPEYDFVYVATGEPHKNHRNLLRAWELLAGEGLWPSLCLTVPEARFPELAREIASRTTAAGLNVRNLGALAPGETERLYARSRALVYPSDFESLGLPLIEARAAGIGVLAAELDFVRDSVDPDEAFDPRSPLSIARAVKRYLGRPEPGLPMVGPEEFLQRILQVEPGAHPDR